MEASVVVTVAEPQPVFLVRECASVSPPYKVATAEPYLADEICFDTCALVSVAPVLMANSCSGIDDLRSILSC